MRSEEVATIVQAGDDGWTRVEVVNESKNGLVTFSVIGWEKMEIMDWEERY